jgi:hypothetical protein
MKSLLVLSTLALSLSSYAADCPQAQGRYNKCYSEIRNIKGEYVVDQHQENNFEVYTVQYNDDETGDSRTEIFKTNGEKVSKKETLPRINVNVKIVGAARCENNKVVSDSDVYFLGAKVGSFVTTIFLEGNILKSNIDGAYLGKDLHKRIVCTRVE